MTFWIAESEGNGTIYSGSISILSPAPTFVRYPDKFTIEPRTSRDGNPILQTPVRDTRPRQWVWKRYMSEYEGYDKLYNKLLNYQERLRETATPPKPPWMWLKEDSSGNLTFRQWNGTTWVETVSWVRVLITQVTQNVADQIGHTVWEELILEFVIDDPVFNLY